jgi:hypothetical protein
MHSSGRLVDLSEILQYILHVGQYHRDKYQELKAKITVLHIVFLALLLGWPPLSAVATAAGLIEVFNSGRIDWCTGTVRAFGIGAPAASEEGKSADSPAGSQDTALRLAHANLLKTLGAIRIDASSRVADRMSQSASFRHGLSTLARTAAVTHREYLSDGTVKIDLTMNLTGGFDQFVLPEEIRQVETVTTVTVTSAANKVAPSDVSAENSPYTGLIIDASEIDARPCLVPVVVDESGEVVYGPAFVSREFAVTRGMSGYATTLPAACNDKQKRVGSRPMVVKAIRTRSTGKTDLVISNADAARLRSSAVHLDFMKACRVIIVVNPFDPSSKADNGN